jgi:hypothetical protein
MRDIEEGWKEFAPPAAHRPAVWLVPVRCAVGLGERCIEVRAGSWKSASSNTLRASIAQVVPVRRRPRIICSGPDV